MRRYASPTAVTPVAQALTGTLTGPRNRSGWRPRTQELIRMAGMAVGFTRPRPAPIEDLPLLLHQVRAAQRAAELHAAAVKSTAPSPGPLG